MLAALRAAWVPIETWSSLLAEVGMTDRYPVSRALSITLRDAWGGSSPDDNEVAVRSLVVVGAKASPTQHARHREDLSTVVEVLGSLTAHGDAPKPLQELLDRLAAQHAGLVAADPDLVAK